MASKNFRYFQACTSIVPACRQFLSRSISVTYFVRPVRRFRLCCWWCGSSMLRTADSMNVFPSLFSKNCHIELGTPPSSVLGIVQLHGVTSNNLKSDGKWTDEQMFLKEINSFSSYTDIFKFVHSLGSLSNTMVASVFQWLCDNHLEKGKLNPKGMMEHEVFKSLCFQLEQESTNLPDSVLVNSLSTLIKLHMDPYSTLVVRLVSESQERLDKGQMTIRNLCILGEALLNLKGPDCAMLEQIMSQLQSTNLEDWGADEMVMAYRFLKLGVKRKNQDLLDKMKNIALTQVSKLGPREISMVLNALVDLDQTQVVSLMIKLCEHSTWHVPHFTDDELVNVLEAFIHFGHNDQFFIAALEGHVSKYAFTMHPNAISKIMQYCSRRHILSKTIFDAVAERFVYNADSFTATQIAEVIVPFGKLNYLPPSAPSLFQKLERILRSRFTEFQPHEVLNLLHSCTLIERYPLNFLTKVFRPYFLQQLQVGGPCLEMVHSQLTQLFLTVILECPSHKHLQLLSKYQVKSFLTPDCSLESLANTQLSNKVKAGLVELLGARYYFASSVLTPSGYTIDIEIKLDEEGLVLMANNSEEAWQRIALCIDDQERFCFNSHHLLGREAVKQRHLQLLGYKVVQIPFFEFEPLNCRKEVLEYLHKKLFPN
nr:FAST kinase domain-containing protein 3, mitochondrial [Pogona vitticeps]